MSFNDESKKHAAASNENPDNFSSRRAKRFFVLAGFVIDNEAWQAAQRKKQLEAAEA